MKFSLKWLQELIDLKTTPEKLAAQFTDAGLEVESIEGDVLEVAVPPNRADCLSMVGLAREAAALNNLAFTAPNTPVVAATINEKLNLEIKNPKSCRRYFGRVIKNIDNTTPTPQYIKERLDTAGIKVISAVVDITNYVLLEWGQPLHAFDLAKMSKASVIVRDAKTGESINLLDGSTKQLSSDTLVIADADKPCALAGIMGGVESSINAATKDIILECAYFDPVTIRLTARKYGLQTDGSYRHERSIDPSMQASVMERVTQLILEVVGGQAGPVVAVTDPTHNVEALQINLRSQRIKKILGHDIPTAKVTAILAQLGMQTKDTNAQGDLTVTVPQFRADITREIDLIEEVVRIFGYGNIPAKLPTGTLAFIAQPEVQISEERILNCLIDRGYNEAITYSFIDQELARQFATVDPTLTITNPISADMSLMRPSLLPGLVNALSYNQNRQQARVRLFESGLRFIGGNKELQQIKTLSGVCSGTNLAENWANSKAEVDFFDLKADVMALCKLVQNHSVLEFKAASVLCMHPGQCVEIFINGTKSGILGALHPAIQKYLGLAAAVYMFELDYAAIANGRFNNFNPISKYPAVRRDLALLLDTTVSAAQLQHAMRKKIGNLLTDVVIFDLYQGKGIPEGKKSIALGLTLQKQEATLTDQEVTDLFTDLISTLEKEFGATLR